MLFPCASVWETLVHEFPISYSHTEWYFLISLFGAFSRALAGQPGYKFFYILLNSFFFLQMMSGSSQVPDMLNLGMRGGRGSTRLGEGGRDRAVASGCSV